MPDRWAVATGNWSNTATWNGGTLPQAGDDVFADGFTVTIDQNVNVLSIRTTQRSGGTAGGGFTLNTGFNVTGNVISGTTTCLTINTASGTHTITGSVTGGTQGGSTGAINKSGNSSLSIIGNVTGGGSSNSVGLNITGGGSVFITGNCLGTGFQQAFGVRYVGGSSLTVNGNVTGGAGNAAYGIQAGVSSMNVTITGTINNGSGFQSNGLNVGSSTTGTVVINGNVITTNGQPTIQLSELNSNISLTINGNVTATAGNAIASISSGGSVAASNTATITVNGNVTSSGPLSAIVHLTNNGYVIVNGNIFSHTTGNVPIAAYRVLLHPSTTMQHEYRVNNAGSPGVARSLYTGGVNLNQPAVSNVRSGIVYGASNEFTGTCAVPGAASVAVGVPVDNTVGTAAITEATIRSAMGLASANLDTQLGNITILADALPTLTEIEASSVLAKSAQITSLQNNAPAEAF